MRNIFTPYAALALLLLAATPVLADTFSQQKARLSVGPNPCAIAAQDLNDDGWPEIITADRGTLRETRGERPANDELSILIAQDKLDYLKHHPSLKTGFAPYAIAIANIDALKWPDILVTGFHASRDRDLSLFLNIKPERVFKPAYFQVADHTLAYHRHQDGEGTPLFTTPGLTALAVSDINHDTLRDVVATAWSSDAIVIFPGDAELSFGEPRLLDAPGAPRDLILTDLDHDGETDIASVQYATGEIALWRGDATGTFTPVGRFDSRGRLPVSIVHADFNADGHEDLAVAHAYIDDSVVVFYGEGDFRFSDSREIALGQEREVLEDEIRDLITGDFNGDGRPDLAAACFRSQRVAALINLPAAGGESHRFELESYEYETGRPRALCATDFDDDGKDDIAVALWVEDAVALLLTGE